MEIVAISDLHGHLPENVGSGDVLVVAGDVCPDFAATRAEIGQSAKQVQWVVEKLIPWRNKQLDNFTRVLITWGNHDFLENLSMWGSDFYEEPTVVEVENKLFYISPYCLSLPGWAFQLSEKELWEHYKRIPIGVDVIVSHGPAYKMLDRCEDGRRVGSKNLKAAIELSRPSVVICGHIHEAFGKYELFHAGSSLPTVVYNVSQRDALYEYKHRPVQILL
jgi:Icc-related predicted phosphoesterase